MRPKTLFGLLSSIAILFGILASKDLIGSSNTSADPLLVNELKDQIAALESDVQLLRRENESLRSLAQGGGEVSPPQELLDFVTSAFGLEFKSSPKIHRIAGEELRDRVIASIESRYGPHGLDSRQQAWTLMGLLSPDDRFAGQLAAMRSIGARAWFDEQSGEAWVTDRFEPSSIPDQAALLRSLVRILLHQHYPPPPGWPGDEPALAREALHHGAAISVENRFLARQALGIGFTGTAESSADARELLANLPVFVRGIATFPSTHGTPFAQRRIDQEEILGDLHSPPLTTSAFYPQLAEIPITHPSLPATEGNTLLEESFGALGLELWLAALDPSLTPLALHWRGDQYRLYATSNQDHHLIWDIQLDSPEAAAKIGEAFANMISSLANRENAPAADTPVTTPEGRRLTWSRPSPTTVRFIHSPS